MEHRKEKSYFLPLTFLTIVISFLFGLFTFFIIDEKVPMNANKILNRVKEQFRADGPIEGSWIEMTKVPWKKYAYNTKVYYGGISRFEEGQIVQYEFVADAYTGTLMDIYKV